MITNSGEDKYKTITDNYLYLLLYLQKMDLAEFK